MAPTRRRFQPRDSSRRRVWLYLGVIAFLLVDIALIVWALSSTRASAADAAGSQSAGPSRPAVPAPTRPAEPGPSAVVEPAPTVAIPPTRILAALDSTTAWRATTAPCPTIPAVPELTTDAGASWTATDAGAAGITAVQRIDVESASIASVIGLDAEDCSPQFARTFVAGDDYRAYPELLDTTWYLDPADPSIVSTPAGAAAAPCPAPVVIAPRDSADAAVLCSDQAAWSTEDGGQTWSAGPVIPGALNLSETDSGYIAVAAGARECTGVQVMQLDRSLAPGASECLPLNLPLSTLSGNVAVAQAAETVWVWAGQQVWRSGDGGATWQ